MTRYFHNFPSFGLFSNTILLKLDSPAPLVLQIPVVISNSEVRNSVSVHKAFQLPFRYTWLPGEEPPPVGSYSDGPFRDILHDWTSSAVQSFVLALSKSTKWVQTYRPVDGNKPISQNFVGEKFQDNGKWWNNGHVNYNLPLHCY